MYHRSAFAERDEIEICTWLLRDKWTTGIVAAVRSVGSPSPFSRLLKKS
jgi:hypothetical protein